MIPVNKIWLFETDLLDPYFIGEKDGITVTLENDDVIDFINIQTVTYFMNTLVKGAFSETFKYGGEDGGIAESTGKSEKEYELQFNMPIENRDNLNRFAGSQYSLLAQRVDGSKFIVFGQFEADNLDVDNRIQNRMTLKTGETSARLFEVNSSNIVNIEYIIDDVVTPAPPPIPSAPTGLNLDVHGNNQINVEWNFQLNVNSYTVEWGTDGFTFPNNASVLGNENTYSITGLNSNTEYFVRVSATNVSGTSPYSNIESATTEALPFTFTWQSDNAGTSNNDQISFPFANTYTGDIDFGDGNIVSYTNEPSPILHTFSGGAGNYEVRINGVIQPDFNNTGDRLKIENISSLGQLQIRNAGFRGCENLTISATDTAVVIDGTSAFRSCVSLTSIPNFDNWDFSSATTLGSMFRDSGINQSFNLNLPIVTNVNSMWRGCDSLDNDITITAPNLTDASILIFGCDIYNSQITIDSNVLSILDESFRNCPQFNTKPIFTQGTSSISDWYRAFSNATSYNQVFDFDISGASNLSQVLDNTGLSTANYDLSLEAMDAQTVNSGLTFGANGLTYTSAGDGGTARASLIANDFWSFVGDSGI